MTTRIGWYWVAFALTLFCCSVRAAELSGAERVYQTRCGVCHDRGGMGQLALKQRLGVERSILTERTDLTPSLIQHVVRRGFLSMPAITRVEVSDAELEVLSAWLTRR